MNEMELNRLLFLKQNPVFQNLDFSFLVAIAPLFVPMGFKPEAMVFDPGVDRPLFLILEEGTIRSGSGQEYSQVYGIRSLAVIHFRLDQPEEIVTAGPDGCRLYQADGRTFIDMIQDIPELAHQILSVEER